MKKAFNLNREKGDGQEKGGRRVIVPEDLLEKVFMSGQYEGIKR